MIDSSEECLTEVSYTNEIKEIIDRSCAYSGCHLNGTAPGDFSSYSGMQGFIDSRSLEKRVLEIQNMPPEYAIDPNPRSLTALEIEMFTCWVQNNHAE